MDINCSSQGQGLPQCWLRQGKCCELMHKRASCRNFAKTCVQGCPRVRALPLASCRSYRWGRGCTVRKIRRHELGCNASKGCGALACIVRPKTSAQLVLRRSRQVHFPISRGHEHALHCRKLLHIVRPVIPLCRHKGARGGQQHVQCTARTRAAKAQAESTHLPTILLAEPAHPAS